MKVNDIKVSNVKTITRDMILNVGYGIAMSWGAEFLDYKINKEQQEIIFYCIEHGEHFYSTLTFKEVYEGDY